MDTNKMQQSEKSDPPSYTELQMNNAASRSFQIPYSAVKPQCYSRDLNSMFYPQRTVKSAKICRCNKGYIRLFSFAQVLLGLACVLFSFSFNQNTGRNADLLGFEYWDGILYFITGAFGLLTRELKIKSLVVILLFLSICSAIVSGVTCCMSFLGLAIIKYDCYYNDQKSLQLEWICPDSYSAPMTRNLVLILLTLLETLAAVWCSVICYKILCPNLHAEELDSSRQGSCNKNEGVMLLVVPDVIIKQQAPSSESDNETLVKDSLSNSINQDSNPDKAHQESCIDTTDEKTILTNISTSNHATSVC